MISYYNSANDCVYNSFSVLRYFIYFSSLNYCILEIVHTIQFPAISSSIQAIILLDNLRQELFWEGSKEKIIENLQS